MCVGRDVFKVIRDTSCKRLYLLKVINIIMESALIVSRLLRKGGFYRITKNSIGGFLRNIT